MPFGACLKKTFDCSLLLHCTQLQQPNAIAQDHARLLAWQRHALQTFLYLALSLAASLFLWFGLMLYPTNFLIAVVRPQTDGRTHERD